MSTSLKKELAKAKNVSHPNSRKSIAIIKKTNKIKKRQKVKLGSFIKQNLIGEKMLWIQQHMEDVCPYTPELTAELLLEYIARNDEELEQIAIKHSVGGKRSRQHASREDILRMNKERELEEYKTCGIEIPDILNSVQCEMLRKWDGELRYLPNFKFRRFGKKDLQTKSNQRIMRRTPDCKSEASKTSNEKESLTETINAESVRINVKENTTSDVNSLENDCAMIVE